MKVGFVIDWDVGISSLMVLARNLFRELGTLMNEKKTFTVSAISKDLVGMGDINQHFDLIHFPNMGGYKFLDDKFLNAKNIIISPSGIDEIIYGEEVFSEKARWKVTKPLIPKELSKWKKNINKIKAVQVAAKSELKEMNQHLGIPLDMMSVIHHGIHHEMFTPSTDKIKTRNNILEEFELEKGNYFIHISEKNYVRKNIIRMLDAFKQAKEAGLKQNLYLLGKKHPVVAKMFSKEGKSKKYPGVHLIGWLKQEHLIEFIRGSDGLLLPSIHEGFGLPLVECMACGIPSITSNRHAPPEVVGNSGILVDPYNVKEISNAIIDLGKNEKLRSELSNNALIRAKDFSWKNGAKSLLQMYEEAVPKSNSSDFEEDYDISNKRTLTTICELFITHPEFFSLTERRIDEYTWIGTKKIYEETEKEKRMKKKYNLILSLLILDYPAMCQWALEFGLSYAPTKDFLLPLEGWLRNNSKNES